MPRDPVQLALHMEASAIAAVPRDRNGRNDGAQLLGCVTDGLDRDMDGVAPNIGNPCDGPRRAGRGQAVALDHSAPKLLVQLWEEAFGGEIAGQLGVSLRRRASHRPSWSLRRHNTHSNLRKCIPIASDQAISQSSLLGLEVVEGSCPTNFVNMSGGSTTPMQRARQLNSGRPLRRHAHQQRKSSGSRALPEVARMVKTRRGEPVIRPLRRNAERGTSRPGCLGPWQGSCRSDASLWSC
jgi:hypothetical protein